ncbi:4-hydroxy-3-methylbut-2-enyl diphosphate reductase [Candidatus Sumerlaeota bacterium]|nr:4-hydroxy-3-methylbut-2-enyl diphosphate reductase [Candidatus Sumerlaeota bacterium]
MEILLAKTAGFCMGVRRAMKIVLDHADRPDSKVMTHGPLIHNPQVIEMLCEKGVRILDDEDSPSEGWTVVVRAHGVTPGEKRRLSERGFDVADATCPHVIRIQRLIEQHVARGDAIVIIGDPGHAEVNGLLGYAAGRGHVVSRDSDVENLSDLGNVCVVSQSTQSSEVFDRLVALLQKRWPDLTVYRTICGSTDRRQKEAVEVARRADAMIVVGGRISANTVRLVELASATGTPTQHVETADEIDFAKLRAARVVGLTAGASTPAWIIEEVVDRLNKELNDDPARTRRRNG